MEKHNVIIDNLINIDPDTMGGTPVFKGTRVPIQTLIDHITRNVSLEEFLEDFPSVTRDQALALLERVTFPHLPNSTV